MSIGNAIQKLKEDIIIKEMTIEALEMFEELDICDQLKAIKESNLRYNKEFRENWIKEILHYKGYVKIESTPNDIIVFYPLHTLYIPTHNYNGVIMEETVEIIEPIMPNEKHKKILESRLEATKEYIVTPSFKNFKTVLKLGSTGAKPMLWWINRGRALQIVKDINLRTLSALAYIEDSLKKYNTILETNSKVLKERERIERELNEDFEMFEQNGLKVHKRY